MTHPRWCRDRGCGGATTMSDHRGHWRLSPSSATLAAFNFSKKFPTGPSRILPLEKPRKLFDYLLKLGW
ncbi:hypothetical protein AAHA92_17367 [Salvia divinorum]|uniref:Uncharacterized protein n=1 Tax=Salvia divinorum TaxID=28513 RepID=A0ABD1GYJ9_SALDI